MSEVDSRLAFPRPGYSLSGTSDGTAQRGMTLRDYFAATVLPAIFSPILSADEVAILAYEIADAMIARSKR